MKSRKFMVHVERMENMRNAYKFFVGNPEENRPLRSPKCRWEANIKIDLGEIEFEGMVWISVAQDGDRYWALVNTAMNLRVP
jgi:hypothetical protein